MAEMNDEQAKQFLEQLAKANPNLAKFVDLSGKMNKMFEKGNKSFSKQLEEIDAYTKSMKTLSGDTLGKFTRGLKEGFSSLNNYSESVKELDALIEQTSNASEKQALGMQREIMAREANSVAMKAAVLDFSKSIGKNVIGGITSTAGKFVTGLQNNASATEISSTLMTSAVDMATGAASTAGQGISKMGDTAMALGKPGSKLQLMGAAASLAGSALAGVAEGAGKMAKFGIEVLSKEVEKTVKSYNNMNNAGALFADGMTGMRNAANDAGLTVEQFSGVVTKHSTDIASLGMSVGEGSKRIGGALKAGGDTMKFQLLNLGYSFEDQAGLVAETMANMRGTGGPLKASNAQVAAETQKYAENLRLISAITGEDAKKKAAQAAEQNQILAFQQKMAGKSETQRAQINAAMATMTEIEKKNFRERAVLGTVINKEGAIYEATIAGAKEKGDAALGLFDTNNLTAETNAELNQQYGEQIKASALAQTDLAAAAMVAGGVLTGVATAGLDAVNQAQAYTTEGLAAAKKSLEEQKNASDELTKGVTSAAIAAQELKKNLEVVLTPAIAQFAKVSAAMLGAVQKQLADLGMGGKPGEAAGPSFLDKLKGAGAGALERGSQGAMIGGMTGTMALPGIGTVGGGTVGAVVGGVAGAIEGWFDAKEGKAVGGIAQGPASGYLEKLHGNEAVIPLGDNRSVPVKLDLSGMGKALSDMSTSSDMASAASAVPTTVTTASARMQEDSAALIREQIGLLNEIKDILTNSKDLQQQYVYNTYN